MLLAVVQNVLATPLPTPEVIQKTLTVQVPVPVQTPDVVVQAAQLAALAGAALVLSLVHQVTEWVTAKEKGWSPQLNRLLATLYSVGVGVVGTAGMGQLGFQVHQLVALVVNLAVPLATTFWGYEVRKAMAALTGLVKVKNAPASDSTLPTVTNP